MTNLIERLQLHKSWRDSHGELNAAPNEAADALKALERDNARMRETVEWIVNCEKPNLRQLTDREERIESIARQALQNTGDSHEQG